jgi:hypothetical protein
MSIRETLLRMAGIPSPELIIMYGPYDAIWPTIGVEGFSWFCEGCGRGDPDPEYPTLADAKVGASDHKLARHDGVKIELYQAHLDPDEMRS